ncbi:hypothetical protein [Altibacter sp. HG106]|uniref:hypothetical protein n=1 Tax=Altibacter sp. HG106 TaxID=3023937 RepID=UPI002350040C|nr:hypothetical protein [Altibacter sp. HG106]MDC7994329.1 hypothetical protein [Altibacter sp. HG106]
MKLSALTLLGVTTLLLITTLCFATLGGSYSWVFVLTCAGQAILVYTVYRILRDDYQTDKTFDDFYEDRPDLGR